jgi:hypothetical protein
MTLRQRLDRLERQLPPRRQPEERHSEHWLRALDLLVEMLLQMHEGKYGGRPDVGYGAGARVMAEAAGLLRGYVESGHIWPLTEGHCNDCLVALYAWLHAGPGGPFPLPDEPVTLRQALETDALRAGVRPDWLAPRPLSRGEDRV